VEVCELLLRYYKPEPTRLRPTDRMVAHTGFLTFGRRIEPSEDERAKDLLEEQAVGVEEEQSASADVNIEPGDESQTDTFE
jgi:tRNA (adenine57-N1/adenine58-N1)-methyltransferase